MTLGNFINFSGPQFPPEYTWYNLALPGDEAMLERVDHPTVLRTRQSKVLVVHPRKC